MAGIRLINLTKRYGPVIAVDDLGLSIGDREFVTLLGPSGCGKTTTLNMIAGLVLPSSGEIWIGDREVGGLPPQQRDCAMVFQSYAIYPHMSVFENIAFPLRARRQLEVEIRRKVEKVAELLKIASLLDRKPKELSGGQRQRVALGRAMVRQPQAFLMDEPLSNLDARLRLLMRVELRKLHEQSGATTIYVTHDQAEAMTLSDRIAVMKDGLLQQYDTPRVIYTQPANTFVASFMGDLPINLFQGELVRSDGRLMLRVLSRNLPLPPRFHAPMAQLADGTSLSLGVRPEAIRILPAAPTDTDGMILSGQVDIIQELGAKEVVYARVDGQDVFAVVEPGHEWHARQPVWLVLDPAQVHIFRADTGVAIR